MIQFYKQYMMFNKNFGSLFNVLQPLIDEFEMNTLNASVYAYVTQQIYNTGLIQRYFLLVEVQFESSTFITYVDTPALSMDQMGSSLGGMLGLWMGISIMAAVELMELVYTLSRAACSIAMSK